MDPGFHFLVIAGWAGAPQSLETSVAVLEASLWQLRHCKVDAWMSGLFCLWDGSVRVYRVTAIQAYVCATVVCATDTNAVEHRLDVIDSWAEGPLAPFWFYFSLEVSSGNSDVCYIHQQNNFLLYKEWKAHYIIIGIQCFYFHSLFLFDFRQLAINMMHESIWDVLNYFFLSPDFSISQMLPRAFMLKCGLH